jgi:D-arabinose 1-dehydrogenase-like Zn-dependent alcohol dehydrogenase
LPEIEVIPIEEINAAYDRMLSKGMDKRFVIDMGKSFR